MNLAEPVRPGEFLITEVDHNFRENGTIAEDEISEQDKAAAIAKLAESFLIVR